MSSNNSESTKREQRQAIIEAFRKQGIEAVYGKNGFFLKGQGFVTFAKARKMTEIEVPENLQRNTYENTQPVNPLTFIAKSGW